MVYQTQKYSSFTSLVNITDYPLFGKELRFYKGEPNEKFLSTQHERDRASNYDHRQARNSTSEFGVFLSEDPHAENYPETSSYAYVLNNPIIYIDPADRDPRLDNKVKNIDFSKHRVTKINSAPNPFNPQDSKLKRKSSYYFVNNSVFGPLVSPNSYGKAIDIFLNLSKVAEMFNEFISSGLSEAYIGEQFKRASISEKGYSFTEESGNNVVNYRVSNLGEGFSNVITQMDVFSLIGGEFFVTIQKFFSVYSETNDAGKTTKFFKETTIKYTNDSNGGYTSSKVTSKTYEAIPNVE